IFMTVRTPIQGIFCSPCAEKKALRATVVTWLAGWWGFPWGFIYSPHAIFLNLLGGKQPAEVNARLAGHQAWVFARSGWLPLARAVAAKAHELATRSTCERQTHQERQELVNATARLVNAFDDGTPVQRLKSPWSLLSRPVLVQAAIPSLFIALW